MNSMNFWNNPKYKAIRVLLVIAVVVGAGYFTVKSQHTAPGNAGQVIDTSSMGSGLVFAETKSGGACTITVTNAANTSQSVALTGALASNGDCKLSAQQSGAAAQSMAAAMGAGSSVATPPAAANTGLVFSESTAGSTCTMTVTNAANTAQSVAVAGTIKGNNDCVANAKQSTAAAQTLAASMTGGASVQ